MNARPTMNTSKLLFLVLFFLIPMLAFADIDSDSTKIMGIVPSQPVNIQMISEMVDVQLSLDSSWVLCTFNMRNLGDAKDVEIGLPMTNPYPWSSNQQPNDADKDKFEVEVNGRVIEKINIYMPKKLKSILDSINVNKGYDLLRDYNNKNKPWYLWKSHFNKNESQVIVVKYALPCGATKTDRFFNYLLNTSAGWQGKIEHAQIIATLRDIPMDQILSISPKHYKKHIGTITWNFKNLTPTIKDDILIRYKMESFYEVQKRKNYGVTYFVNSKKVKEPFENLNPNDIVSIAVNRNHPYEKYGAVYIYTNGYVLKTFEKKIKHINRSSWKQISNESTKNFANKYQLIVNNKSFTGEKFFNEINALDTIPILKVSIRKTDSVRSDLIITTKE